MTEGGGCFFIHKLKLNNMTLTEWIFSKLPTIDKDDPYYRDIFEVAKQMEKEQVELRYKDGTSMRKYNSPKL